MIMSFTQSTLTMSLATCIASTSGRWNANTGRFCKTSWCSQAARDRNSIKLCHIQSSQRVGNLRQSASRRYSFDSGRKAIIVRADIKPPPEDLSKRPNPKETTEKYGLEAGLWQVFRNKDPVTGQSKGQQAKDLLKRYGGAYLITSISFAIVSFAACYALVSAGVDVSSLLGKVGINVNATSEKVGTAAIAYAAHKALSPVRFPPTVALTPVVARFLGKGGDDPTSNSSNGNGPAP